MLADGAAAIVTRAVLPSRRAAALQWLRRKVMALIVSLKR
jgi:hypothetical protein